MRLFVYKAKKGIDEFLDGQIEASTKHEALSKVDSLGLFPISIEEKKSFSKNPDKVYLKEILEFTNQLSALMNSGSTLVNSLNTLVIETEQPRLKPLIINIVSGVKEGNSFSQTLKNYPKIFSELYVSLVEVGETSGTLGENLMRIGEFLEEELDFKTNLVSIATYPLLILTVGFLTVLVLLKFVIPKLVDIFQEIEQTLPVSTAFLVYISGIFSKYWYVFIGLMVLFVFGIKKYFKSAKNKLKWDQYKLSITVIGGVLKKIEIGRLARTLAILLKNGVSISRALVILEFTTPNLIFRQAICEIKGQINEGASLNSAMKNTGVFPMGFINAVTVGEDSGTLGEVLESLSFSYKKDIDRKIKNLMTILEPLLIIGLGLIIGFVVLSMLLPIFKIDFNF
ncbi:MAG: type II secretion system F family protein [Candidatus Omnitrophica bacterium]|nr:type II secretion system F family protein [Candidatus Omnitrophota bacterium]